MRNLRLGKAQNPGKSGPNSSEVENEVTTRRVCKPTKAKWTPPLGWWIQTVRKLLPWSRPPQELKSMFVSPI